MEVVNVTPGTAVNTPTVNQVAPQAQAPDGNKQLNDGNQQLSQEPAKMSPEEKKFYELKANGRTRKVTLDEMRQQAELGMAAYEKFDAAAQKEKAVQNWKETAKKDMMKALLDPELGLSRDEIRQKFEQWYKNEFIDPESMSKEERRAVQAERERDDALARAKLYEDQQRAEAEERENAGLRDSVQKEIIEFLETSGLPKTRFFANRAIFWKRQALAKGYDAPTEVIKQQVKDEFCDVIRTFTKEANDEQLVDLLGEDILKKLRKYDLARLKKRMDKDNHVIDSADSTSPRTRKGSIPMSEVDKRLNQMRLEKVPRRS